LFNIFSREAWQKHEIQVEGKEFARSDMPQVKAVYNWLLSHKKQIGSVFGALWLWAEIQGCPAVFGDNVLSTLHLTCTQIDKALDFISAFLVGGGLLDSDFRAAYVQAKTNGTAKP
jgi:hypothetical protein